MAEKQDRGKRGGSSIERAQENLNRTARESAESRPVRSRRARLFEFGLGLALAGFLLLAFLARTYAYFPIDLAITRLLQAFHPSWFDALMRAVSWPGFMPQSVIVVIVLCLPVYAAGLRWEALAAVCAALGETLLNLLAKAIIHRPRPPADVVQVVKMLASFSFPSGHVMFYSGFFGFLWFLAYTHLKPSLARSLILVGFGLLVGLVGVSRIYLGEHWASDVAGGYLLGGLGLFLIVRLYRWGTRRFFV